eukprot:TRINITY_DN4628_c0_g1_i1.p1 TRINITY_DN4628_c0_g1~~TRINITY_DN4628_c0_g1_i1.p1  ORF type:complete len:4446 (+),score=1210.10 TRINITY_DN4628_c0_g1_i1:73-13338(+)
MAPAAGASPAPRPLRARSRPRARLKAAALFGAAALACSRLPRAAAQALLSLEPTEIGLGGGVPLTVHGQGFSGDQFMGANRVFVGGVECFADDAFTRENRLVCPRAPPSSAAALSAQPLGSQAKYSDSTGTVEVNADGRWVRAGQLALQYKADSTPFLEGIEHAAVDGARIAFRGRLISRLPAEYRVEFGSEERFGEFRVRCSVLDELHDQEIKDVAHEPNDQRAWHCQAKEQPAGFYNASVSIEPDLMTNEQGVGDSGSEVAPSQVGTALPAQPDIFDLFKMTPAGEPYVMAVHALVRSMSANVGSPAGGSVLVLSGSGFSPAGENATVVEVGGAPCHIVSADTAEIVCKVPPQGAVKQRRAEDMQTCASCAQAGCCVPGGAGALVSTWNDVREAPAGSGFRDQPKVGPVALGTPGERIRPGVLRRDRESREADEQAVWHKDMTHWDVLQHGSHFVHNSERYNGDSEVPEALKLRNTGKVYSGYFVPPHAGPYTFYISGNDFAEVWLARNGQMEMICDAIMSEPSRPGRYFNDKDSKPISDPITLTKGSPVYIEVLHADHTGDNFFHLGVSHPPPTGGGAPPYSTVPTMATLLVMSGTESFFINEKRVRLAANCNHDPAAEVESALGRDSGAHVVGSKRSFDSGGCRYFFAVYRPQGTLKIEGDAVKVLLQGSLDWYYEPLPMYMMQLPARRSFAVSVGLSVNGLPAAFAGTEGMTWSYQTQFRVGLGTGTLSPAVVRSGGVLSIDVTPATQLTAAEARVTVGGKPCANDGSSGKAPLRLRSSGGQRFLDCDLPNLEAGAQEVGINLGRYGTPTNTPGGGWQVQYHLTVAGFRQVDLGGDAVPRVVASAEGSLYGGAKVTIVGGGFHVSSPDSNSVQFGGRLCPIVSATATELVCVAPASAGAAAGTVQVRVTVAGCSQCGLGGTLSYTYSTARTPQLSGVTVGGSSGSAPSSGGATVVVTGTRFPTARSTLQVVFCKAGQIVGCTGCAVADSGAAPSATQVECSSPVLEDGAYEVRVLDTKLGWSNPGSRLQTAFRVSEIAPQRCSTEGGAILTISGQGFTKDNFVMLGPVSEVGLECAHRNTTSTQIICQVERNTKQYRGYLRVRVYANKEQSYEDLLHASCDATQRRQAQALQGNGSGTPPAQSPFSDVCQVNFDSGVTAAVTRRNGNGHNSRYTITGTGLGDTVEVRAGGARCDPDTLTVSGTQVTCTMGTGPAGTYRLEVTSRAGFAKLPASERNQWVDFPVVVSEVLPPQGSRGGGMEMVINGFGFHPGATSAAIGDVPCKLLANVTGERIVCLSGLQPTSGSRTVNVTANGISGARNNGWTSSTDDTADVRTVEPNELTPAQAADVVLTVSGMRFPSGNFSVQVGGRDCAVESSTTRKLECRVRNLPALSARPLLITDTGFSVSTREQAVLTAPLSWGAPDGLPLRSGQAGGRRIRLAGEGISDRMHENRVSVCGFPCEVVSSKVGELECLTPRLFTRVSANLFGGTPQAIKFMPHPENRHAAPKMAPMLDGDGETSGLMDRSQSLVIRVEGSSLADIREVWFWPSEDPQAGRKDLLHAVFEARSNPAGYDDGGGWRLLHNVTQIPPTGWSKIVLGDDALKIPPASEVRMRPVEGERIGLTELRIIGFETASGVRTASDGNALCNVAVNVTVQPPWPQPAGDPVIVTKDGAVRYEIALTPIVHAFAPEYGTAAGGTLISIFGERLAATGGGTPEVKVDDVPCTGVRTRACTAAESQGMPAGAADCSVVMCTTGARPQLPDESKVGVTVSIPGKGWAHIAVDPFMYADLWSSALTWRGQQLPAHGDIVLLPKGRNIIVDRSPLPPGEKLMFMLVDGALIFSDEWTQGADETDKEIRLDLNYMLIRGGTLKIGSKNKPYSRGATITLHGDKYRDVPLPVYGIKNIAVRGGTVQLFGQPKVPTWTRLGATAVRGATSIRLRERTNWAVGDQIVIAPGSYSNLESEVRNITAVDRSRGYDVLFFSDALRYEHFGTTELHQGHVIDMSVEVGCLSRSIRIQGDPDSWKQKFGAHMIFHSPNRPLVANLEYVELRRVGQAKQVGRYPIHFHIEKDRPEDVYVKGCAIHNSFNRAIVLHDTNHLDIRENVAFNALGHMFFVEDGAERYNTFTRNLGILALPTGGQLSHDVFTSVFWGANPLNNFIGNAAAGSSHMGFWISPPKHPRQSSYDPTKCPNQVPLGLIQGNTAHSNGRHGFWVHPDHFGREIECGSDVEQENPYAFSEVDGLVTWKNREQGCGIVDSGPYLIKNVISIDNDDAGIEVGGIVGEQGAIVRDSVMIASSKNRPGEFKQLRGKTGHRGLIGPQSEGLHGINLTFIGWNDDIPGKRSEHAAFFSCCRCWNDCSSEMGAFTFRFTDIKFFDTRNRLNFGWPHKDIIFDVDGSFTGTPSRPGVPGSTVLPAMPHLKLPGCEVGGADHWSPYGFKTFTGKRKVPGMVCPPKYHFHRLIVYQPVPENQLFYNYSFGSPSGISVEMYDEAVETRPWTNGWSAIVATADDPKDNVPWRVYFSQYLDFHELKLWIIELPYTPFKSPLQIDLNHTNNYFTFDVVARQMAGIHLRRLADMPSIPFVYPLSFQGGGDRSAHVIGILQLPPASTPPPVLVVTGTETLSLPRATTTETFTLPQATSTMALATVTETFTMPTAGQTETVTLGTATDTFTLPTAAQSETQTFTLPTGGSTVTLPTMQDTVTQTLPDATATVTLPGITSTVTMPTVTGVLTATLPTSTLTVSLPTQTFTLTLPTLTRDPNEPPPGYTVPPYPPSGAFPGGIAGPLYKNIEGLLGSTANMDTSRKVLSLILNHDNDLTLSNPYRGVAGTGRSGSHMVQINPIQCPRVGNGQCISIQPAVEPPEIKDWFDPSAWDTGSVPADGASVFIRQGRTILLRGQTAVLSKLIIQGALILLDDGDATVQLHASYIFIQGGRMQIGNDTNPFDNDKNAEVILYGNFQTPGLAVSNEHWLGAAVLANFGELAVRGRPARSWTTLASTAAAGATTITVQDSVAATSDGTYKGWRVGDKIWITSTDYEGDNYEIREIASVSTDGLTITLTEALVREHLGVTIGDFDLRGQVGLLTRNVRITAPAEVLAHGPKDCKGGPACYGCHVVFSEVGETDTFKGRGYLKHMEISATGQFAGDRGGLFLDRLKRNSVTVSHVSIWSNNVYALKIDRVDVATYVQDSVFFISRQVTVQIKNTHWHVRVQRNLAGGTQQEGDGKVKEIVATYFSQNRNWFHYNVAAGSWESGFIVPGDSCSSRSATDTNRMFIGNEAHSGTIGVWLLYGSWCTEMKGNRVWRNSYFGVWTMKSGITRLSNVMIHDNHQGVSLYSTGGHKSKGAEIQGCIIAGRSTPTENCSNFPCVAWHQDEWRHRRAKCHPGPSRPIYTRTFNHASIGMVVSQARGSPKKYEMPQRALQLPVEYDLLGKAAKWGYTRVRNTIFRNFNSSLCGDGDAVITTMKDARTHVLPIVFTNVTWENVDENAKFHLYNPSPKWRTGVQCGLGWECSGLDQALFSSTDGSLHGTAATGVPDAVVSKLQGIATSACTWVEMWNGYKCPGVKYGELFTESKDWDSEERRIYPLRVQKKNESGVLPDYPFYLVNQPPDKYKETEWPSFKRPSWFWYIVELQKHYRIDFGDLPPRETYWELRDCPSSSEKVLISIFFPEKYRTEVWLDPDNNETGRTPSSSAMVNVSMDHSANYWDNANRMLHVVVQCGKGFLIKQVLLVKVAMRLEMTVEEFFDTTSSEQFATNMALLLGIPASRVRIVDVRAGSVIVDTEIEAESGQSIDPQTQQQELTNLVSKIQSTSKTDMSSKLGVAVAEPSTWANAIVVPGTTPATCGDPAGNETVTTNVQTNSDSSLCQEVASAIVGRTLTQTGTITDTVTLPTGAATATVTDTGTMTAQGTATVTLTETAAATATLPTVTATETATVTSTGPLTPTFTLPTTTATETVTMPTASATATVTASDTVSLPSDTATLSLPSLEVSLTLPSRTITPTVSLYTAAPTRNPTTSPLPPTAAPTWLPLTAATVTNLLNAAIGTVFTGGFTVQGVGAVSTQQGTGNVAFGLTISGTLSALTSTDQENIRLGIVGIFGVAQERLPMSQMTFSAASVVVNGVLQNTADTVAPTATPTTSPTAVPSASPTTPAPSMPPTGHPTFSPSVSTLAPSRTPTGRSEEASFQYWILAPIIVGGLAAIGVAAFFAYKWFSTQEESEDRHARWQASPRGQARLRELHGVTTAAGSTEMAATQPLAQGSPAGAEAPQGSGASMSPPGSGAGAAPGRPSMQQLTRGTQDDPWIEASSDLHPGHRAGEETPDEVPQAGSGDVVLQQRSDQQMQSSMQDISSGQADITPTQSQGGGAWAEDSRVGAASSAAAPPAGLLPPTAAAGGGAAPPPTPEPGPGDQPYGTSVRL